MWFFHAFFPIKQKSQFRIFVIDSRILIKFNVNHTVDSENDDGVEFDNQQQAQQEPPKLLSKPTFEVDIVKNDTTLSLTCNFLTGQASEGEYGNFQIWSWLLTYLT